MISARLAALLLLVPALAACGNNPEPPPAAPAASTPAPAPAPDASPMAANPVELAPAQTDIAAAFAPIAGRWSADLASCGAENGTITISQTSFEGYENTCAINELANDGNGNFTASMSCQSEGQTATERVLMRPVFAPTGEGVELTYLDRGGEPVTILRCAAP